MSFQHHVRCRIQLHDRVRVTPEEKDPKDLKDALRNSEDISKHDQ